MEMIKNFFQNTRKPKGLGGKIILFMMNIAHNSNAMWGLSHVSIKPDSSILDIGCGGGRNIQNLLKLARNGHVTGIDYSEESVAASKRNNKKAIEEGRVEVREGSVSTLPFSDNSFDLATAFETIYFWPDIINDFKEVLRVLKPGGTFFICNELADAKSAEKWIKMINFEVYTKDELSDLMKKAGFENIKVNDGNKGPWICLTAQKPSEINH